MKKGWEIKKLGDVYDVRDGTHDSPKYIKEGFALITSKNLKNDALNYDNVNYITEQDYININKRSKVDVGDVLFAMIGTIGNPIVIKDEPNFAIKNVALFKIPRKQDSYFLKYYLDSKVVIDRMSKDAKGATQKFVGLGYLRNFEIPLPPLPEQQRIVAILDEAFAAIAKAKANAEQNLKNAKALFESYLQGVFNSEVSAEKGWEEKCLDELGVITSSKRIYKSEYVKKGVPFYRTKEIKELSNSKEISLELFISKERYEEIKRSFGVPKIGDLLMSAVGTIGEIMVIENEEEFYFKDGNIVWFKGFESLNINYLKYALTAFVEKIKNLAIGAAYSALTIEKLNRYKIAFPKSLTEQLTIVQKLDALSAETKKLETIYQKKINDLDVLKKSILQKAFSGELKTSKEAVA
ncbi:type I restriction enzyme S subunit [Nitrosomonas ureae]|uniref:restriction endonuclease subunit S n=1 Tax=Nitrosomonas ureae TaxID=44577 RepID=UPI000D763688|nr:restriction endonuclease subunit S [Nitrosomonas ureae]PXX14764.1 type I restriction enzyme S subunit [Nitrosomonas ureae]